LQSEQAKSGISGGGTMPENLPTPKKSIPQLQKEYVKAIKSKKVDK
jgi:hypothetical protein